MVLASCEIRGFLSLNICLVSANDVMKHFSFSGSIDFAADDQGAFSCIITGSPSSKYEHRRASALLRNIQNIRICMGKKCIVSVTYENERISIKNSLPYLKCVLRLSCVVHGPIYGRFVGFYVNGFLSI